MSEEGPALRTILDVVGTMWTFGHTAEQLGLTPAELTARIRKGCIIGLCPYDPDRISFPIFQFWNRNGQVEVKPGLADYCAALLAAPDGGPRDPWSVALSPVPRRPNWTA